jgi:hypothetical protein
MIRTTCCWPGCRSRCHRKNEAIARHRAFRRASCPGARPRVSAPPAELCGGRSRVGHSGRHNALADEHFAAFTEAFNDEGFALPASLLYYVPGNLGSGLGLVDEHRAEPQRISRHGVLAPSVWDLNHLLNRAGTGENTGYTAAELAGLFPFTAEEVHAALELRKIDAEIARAHRVHAALAGAPVTVRTAA